MQADERSRVRHALLNQLAMREHSAKELFDKQLGKGYDAALIREQIADLQTLDLQSDMRFSAAFTRMRIGQGKGLGVIRQELGARGIDKELIAETLAELDMNWAAQASRIRVRKFGEALPATPKDKAKQLRFLASRGFSAADAYAALAHSGANDGDLYD